MNQLNLKLKDFVDILEKDNSKTLDYWRDLIKVYNSTLGGCNCSKKSRETNAMANYISKVTDTNKNNPELIDGLKKHLNTEKILFIYEENTVFLEV